MTLSGRATYHHGNLRQALIDAARRLIGERGTEGFSLREAARDLGVTAAATYRHFNDKAALLGAVAAESNQRFCAELELALCGAGSAAERFRALGHRYVGFAQRHPAEFGILFGSPARPDQPPPARALVARAISALRSAGVSRRDDEAAVLTTWSALHGLAGLAAAGQPVSGAELDQVLDTLLVALAGDPG